MTYLTERRPIRTTGEDCTIRGGEYVAGDRADYGQSLKIWLVEAQQGSADAQYYTATLYEKGAAGQPDFSHAAEWYRKAAEQGNKRASIGLGRLYEQGAGMKQDPAEAFRWYARASGLDAHALSNLMITTRPDPAAAERIQELERTLVVREQDIKKLADELASTAGLVATLRRDLHARATQAHEARATLQQQEEQALALQAELTQLKATPDSNRQTAALQQQLQQLAAAMTQERRQLADRDAEVTRLQTRIALLDKNAERLQVLEQSMARKDSETQALRDQLVAANHHLAHLSDQLAEQQRLAADERRNSLEAEQRYQATQAQVEQLRAKPDQTGALAQAEATVTRLQEDMRRATRETESRNQEIAQLQRKIATLEREAEQQATALQTAAVIDLGFDGPSLDIIDPPLARTRGVQVAKAEPVVPVSPGGRRSITGRVLAPAGLRMVTVNGERVQINDEGIFTATLPAPRSDTDEVAVQILAVDVQNKRAVMKFVLKARGAAQIPSASSMPELAAFGRYHALVIGNDHYAYWPPLANAIADATAIAKVLEERYGFQVTLLKDASRVQILKALNHYRKVLTEKDNLLIYYAGHGYLEQGIDRGYWIPVDAETNDNSEWVLLPSVTDMLQLISAKHVMVVADSCFSGKLTRSSLAQLKPGLTEEARFNLLQTLAKQRVRTAMTSGGVKPVLDTGGGGHSVFAEALLGVLEDNTSLLEAERLFWAVRTRVFSTAHQFRAEQLPTYDPLHMAGHESLGDFIFVPKSF